MKKLVKAYSLLFYLLVIILSFILGVIYASKAGLADNQGLAGGAIVLGYGVITAFIAFLVSLIVAYRLPGKSIVKINKLLGIVFLVVACYLSWRFYTRSEEQEGPERQLIPTKPTAPAEGETLQEINLGIHSNGDLRFKTAAV